MMWSTDIIMTWDSTLYFESVDIYLHTYIIYMEIMVNQTWLLVQYNWK